MQVGESFFERNLNPAPDVDASMEAVGEEADGGAAEAAGVSEGVDEGAADDSFDAGEDVGDGGEAGVQLSDSMVPLVGDSVLQVTSKWPQFIQNEQF